MTQLWEWHVIQHWDWKLKDSKHQIARNIHLANADMNELY